MRWIIVFLLSCLIGFSGCGESRGSNPQTPNNDTDGGFNLGEDAGAGSDVKDHVADSDAKDHATDAGADSGVGDGGTDNTDVRNSEPDAKNDPQEPGTCATSADCTGARSVCDPMSQLCVDCLFDAQCADGGRCIERVCKTEGTCESDLECADVDGKLACNHALRECVVSCNNSLDCKQGDVCDPAKNHCVQCASNSDCGTGERCVDTQCEEYLACRSDNQCTPHGLLCNVERGACNECENDAGCPTSYFCEEGRCVVDQCVADAMRCAGSSIEKCIEGKYFETVQVCSTSETCVQDDNVAVCESCTNDNQCSAGMECKEGRCERKPSDNCPTITAQARLVGSGQYQSIVTVQPLQNIEFNAESTSGEGALVYEWSIISSPASSRAQLTPNNAAAKPKLWVSLAGNYEIELVVYDTQGNIICDSSIVTIHVVPNADIHIQLTWFSPAVPNPIQGQGTDLDLHYRHPDGTKWNDSRYTVYWNTRQSSSAWGNTPDRVNRATLDIDDMWGETTENINHMQPLNNTYEIGVHYYNDNGKGSADATLRVFVRGVLKHEVKDKRMQHKQFWRVGALSWPTGEMTPIGQVVCDTTLAGFTMTGCRP